MPSATPNGPTAQWLYDTLNRHPVGDPPRPPRLGVSDPEKV